MLLAYFYAAWPFDIAIPLYGFILLVIKKPKLFSQKEANSIQKPLGLILLLASFLLYFPLVRIFPNASFYSVANYAAFIIGLFLVFFDIHALKEAFTPLLLIVATTLTSFASELAEPVLSPYVIPSMTSLIVTIIRAIGIRTELEFLGYQIITIYTPKGPVSAAFIWGCVGFASALIFSIILVIVLFEETCSLRTKMLWSIIGLIGVFFLNIFRVVMIFITDYFYGYEAGAQVHYFIGYAIFITWISIFFYAFSKKHEKTPKTPSEPLQQTAQ